MLKYTINLIIIQSINTMVCNMICRLGEFTKFVETAEDLAKQLQREDLSTDEYKDLQAQFQVSVNFVILDFVVMG